MPLGVLCTSDACEAVSFEHKIPRKRFIKELTFLVYNTLHCRAAIYQYTPSQNGVQECLSPTTSYLCLAKARKQGTGPVLQRLSLCLNEIKSLSIEQPG